MKATSLYHRQGGGNTKKYTAEELKARKAERKKKELANRSNKTVLF